MISNPLARSPVCVHPKQDWGKAVCRSDGILPLEPLTPHLYHHFHNFFMAFLCGVPSECMIIEDFLSPGLSICRPGCDAYLLGNILEVGSKQEDDIWGIQM